MNYKSNHSGKKTAQKIVSMLTILVAACLLGTVGYMVVGGIINPAAPLPSINSSSTVPDSSSAPASSSVPVPVPTPQEIAATSYNDSPYFVSALPVLVNNSNKIADGLEDTMMNNDDFVQLTDYGTFWVHKDASAALKAMLDDAKAAGIKLSIDVRGAFRTLARQQARYDAIIAAGGTEDTAKLANAVPGYCENELGTAVDFEPDDASFASTDAYTWLAAHCTDYGFVLRFAQDKEAITGVTYQPYHFRYVGINHAKAMTDANLCLEEYLAG